MRNPRNIAAIALACLSHVILCSLQSSVRFFALFLRLPPNSRLLQTRICTSQSLPFGCGHRRHSCRQRCCWTKTYGRKSCHRHKGFWNRKQAKHRKLVIPGKAAHLSEKTGKLSGWQMLGGPKDSSSIPKFLQEKWQNQRITFALKNFLNASVLHN